ncbi:MAG: hypothetical protein H7177_08430 [Rhizobacter sp.]|nr:hypothetical protein [Bacteriovorax sp.]
MSNKKVLSIKLTSPLDEHAKESMDNNLPYLSSSILSYQITSDSIILEVKNDTDLAALEQSVHDLLKKVKPLKSIPVKVLFDQSQANFQEKGDVFSELVSKGDVIILQEGFVALKGLPLHMFMVLDNHLTKFAKTQQAEPILLPVTVHFDDLMPAHYFQRTPQHANFISPLEEEAKNISDFSKLVDGKNVDNSVSLKPYLKEPKCICRSAVCLNCYPTLRNRVFKNDESLVYTAEGRVFRHEYKKVTSLERLFEFSCREIIYFGSKDFVKTKLAECETWFKNFLTEFKLNSSIKAASDPFFQENARALQFYQVAEDSKFEIRVLNPFSGNDVSIGSMNFHGFHFSKAFNITFANKDFVFSGCVGFGLERTIFTVLAQYGVDSKKWPENLRKFFEIN